MELEKAKETVFALTNGVDPMTGEVLPDVSPYNDPRVLRALFALLEASKYYRKPKQSLEEKQQENLDSGRPRNAGLPWSDDLRAEVASRYQSGTTIDELATHFERTRGAIVSELERQGLIDRDAAVRISRQSR